MDVSELQSKCVEMLPLAHSWCGLASFELLLATVSGDRTAAQSSFTEFLEEVFAQWQRTAEDEDEDEDWELQMREDVALILKALLYFGTDTAIGVALKDALADNAATSEHGAQVVMQILQCYCNSDLTAACGGNVFLQSLVCKIIASHDFCIQPQEARAGSCYEDAKQIEMVEALISVLATRLPSEEMLEKVCLSIVSNQARFDPERVLGPLLYKVLHPPLSPAPASCLPYDTALRKSRMKMCSCVAGAAKQGCLQNVLPASARGCSSRIRYQEPLGQAPANGDATAYVRGTDTCCNMCGLYCKP